ncbi:MAG: replicative DNA helicase [Chloroflexaceae bacterium]|nr:replicative DNA helicase [Chloroflexaceae bacterium]
MERVLPADINAERATLGSVLLDREAIIVVASWLAAEYFYLEKHSWIYQAALDCYHERIPPDISTVADALRRRDQLDLVGGIAYLGELSAEVPTAVHIEYYGRIVERTALLRRLIEAGGKITALGYDEREEIETTLDRAEAELFAVSQRRATQDFVHIETVVHDYFSKLQQINEHRGEPVGIPTGYYDLDRLTGGLQQSDMIVLAARPSAGKTSFALSIAYNVAFQFHKTIGIFSLEMSREQLMQRLLSMHTGIDTQRLRTGMIDLDLETVIEAMGMLASASIYIDDTPGLSVMEVRSRARRLQAQTTIDLVIIDYLQLMRSGRSDNRVQEVSEISRGLKALARELHVPVIAISQLSRAVEGRMNHVPMLSDLRESGCLTGETLIYLPQSATYARLDQLIGQTGFQVLALNEATGQFEPRVVEHAFATGEQPVYCLTTRCGQQIRATANHPFLTHQGWQRLDALMPEQPVARLDRRGNTMQATLGWDEIVLLESAGIERVYDLTVEGLHNFVANGIVAHNSIEQDADLVAFIYREEMYDKETDRKGIAEIHIAKHRNGPLGVVPLRFEARTTRFQNLERYAVADDFS